MGTASGGPRARRTALLLSVGYAIALFHRTAFQAIDAPIRAEFGLSLTTSADLASTFFWTYLATMIPAGLLTDAIGARRVAVYGCIVTAVGSFLFSASHDTTGLVVGRALVAVGAAGAFVSLMRYVTLAFPLRKATYSGRGIFLGNLGAMASGGPLALVLATSGWRDTWFSLALASLALAIAIWSVAPTLAPAIPTIAPERHPLRELRILLSSRWIYVGVLVLAGLSGPFYAFGNVIGPRWLALRGVEPIASGWDVTLLIGGYALGAATWGWIADRSGEGNRSLVVAACGGLACWLALAALPAGWSIAIAPLVLLAGMCCGAFALAFPLVGEHHDPRLAGGVVACVNCGTALGAATLQSVAGRFDVAFGPWLLVAGACVSVAASALLLRDSRRRAPDQNPMKVA